MTKNFVEELRWRGMLHDIMPGTEDILEKEMTSGYVGIDPTADSLHIGHLVGVMILCHMQQCGHRPVVLIGGATGMIGDPSGKSQERNLLDLETLRYNQKAIQTQLEKFLDFTSEAENKAVMVNNYDWMQNFSFLDFIREVGKHITVNYMMAKDSVKKRLAPDSGEGMSFTEFTYQLVQGYDFLHLYKTLNCKIQMGGSDQWGNITTGTELIRRVEGGNAFALTAPLIKKADGTKFGKTETGNIWLDPEKTSPYQFYQFWLNTADIDAESYIKIFSLKTRKEIEALIAEHQEAPHLRTLQRHLAEELTARVHSPADLLQAQKASEILFGKATETILREIDSNTLLQIFEGVPQFEVERSELAAGLDIVALLGESTGVFSSKGEARKMIQANGVSINKTKVGIDKVVGMADLLNDRYLLAQKGKKNYYLLIVN
ncbi:MAG: tyrosine--tRNA ligase [Schleiferiaceae bacterium]|nr:tyrosine--tRNA ligase [Schleiferiaceae bacterium]